MAATSRPPHPALLRYCARPPFALERLSVSRGADGQIARIRYVLPRHKVANWVGPSRSRKSTRPGANGVVDLSPFAGRMPVRRSSQTLALAATAHGGRGQGWPCRQMSSRPARRSRAAAAQAPAQVSRGVCTQPQAQAGRHVVGDRERRKAPRGGGRRAWGRRLCHGRMLRRKSESQAPLARHVSDCLGQADGPGGGGVSTCVPSVWRRYPADHVHHGAGADSEDPDTSGWAMGAVPIPKKKRPRCFSTTPAASSQPVTPSNSDTPPDSRSQNRP